MVEGSSWQLISVPDDFGGAAALTAGGLVVADTKRMPRLVVGLWRDVILAQVNQSIRSSQRTFQGPLKPRLPLSFSLSIFMVLTYSCYSCYSHQVESRDKLVDRLIRDTQRSYATPFDATMAVAGAKDAVLAVRRGAGEWTRCAVLFDAEQGRRRIALVHLQPMQLLTAEPRCGQVSFPSRRLGGKPEKAPEN